jgi:serine/threonine-protein kinase TTK/MPS1
MPIPMKFSAQTKALLNDEASIVEPSPVRHVRTVSEPQGVRRRSGSANIIEREKQGSISPPVSRGQSPAQPLTRRVVRLSGASSLRRTSSLSSAIKRLNDQQTAPTSESPLDLSTPAPAPRTVRIPITSSGNHGLSSGSSARNSHRIDSASRSEEPGSQEPPTTGTRSHLANSQGSVSKYGQSTIGRARYGEEAGAQSSIRMKRGVEKVAGKYMSVPARRGRRRMEDEDQSPLEEHDDALDNAGASQIPPSQETQAPRSQDQHASQEPELIRPSLYSSFATGSPVGAGDEILGSILRSKSPPPPTISSSQRSSTRDSHSRLTPQPAQAVYKIPPRPQLPSANDQENEAPPTFKRNKQAPLIHLDVIEKAPVRPVSMDLDALHHASPERRPLAPRSQNTPRRPAPPPPKMSILDAATSTAGAATTAAASGKRNRLKLNGKYFTRLDCIGRGGSSRVYRVMAENSKFFALKRVSLDDADENAVRGFKGEIDLLRKLEGVERVIRLYDYELNEEKGTLSVVCFPTQPCEI